MLWLIGSKYLFVSLQVCSYPKSIQVDHGPPSKEAVKERTLVTIIVEPYYLLYIHIMVT